MNHRRALCWWCVTALGLLVGCDSAADSSPSLAPSDEVQGTTDDPSGVGATDGAIADEPATTDLVQQTASTAESDASAEPDAEALAEAGADDSRSQRFEVTAIRGHSDSRSQRFEIRRERIEFRCCQVRCDSVLIAAAARASEAVT